MFCFADDLLMFCNADPESVGIMKKGTDLFAALSGLRANQEKSHVFISAAASSASSSICQALGFPRGQLPMRYLGVPLVTRKLRKSDCAPLLKKVDERIGSWTNATLNYAGRVQLIKSVLSAFHVYWSSIFILPKGVLQEIEARMRQFLWKGASGKGYAKVAWVDVCRPAEFGGLGIRPLLAVNQALMIRHIWALLTDRGHSVWVDWVRATKLRGRSFWQLSVTSSTPWCWKQFLKLRPIVRPMLEYRVGDGASFSLWFDPWHEMSPLLLRHPRGPIVSGLHRDVFLSAVIRGGTWDWPSTNAVEIRDICASLPGLAGGQDRVLWRMHSSGSFTSASALRAITGDGPRPPWVSLFHGPCRIPRNSFILWLAVRERLSTLDKPWVGGHLASMCRLCEVEDESHSHLFFDCRFSRVCLRISRQKVRFQWPFPDNWSMGVQWASSRWRGKHLVNVAYRLLLAALVYFIWQERNHRMFQDLERTPEVVSGLAIDMVRDRLLSWRRQGSLQDHAIRRIWHIAW